MTTIQQVPVAAGLFTFPADEPRLLGSRCDDCGVSTFPRQGGCPKCSSERMQDVEFDRVGTIWTWTTQAFRPKTPPYLGPESEDDYVPYLVGYVEIAGQVKVEARLVEVAPADMAIGMEVELVIVPFRREGDTEFVTFAFRPRP